MSLPSPAELDALQKAGGWILVAALAVLIVVAFIRGDIVPGWIYKREIARADKATDLVAATTGAIDHLTGAVKEGTAQTTVLIGLVTRRQR